MATHRPDPHKKRTRGHVIADLSVNHVEKYIIDGGFSVERMNHDYGFDLVVYTFDEEGYAEEGDIILQLKATDTLVRTRRGVTFRIDARDYNLLTKITWPVFLVVFDAAEEVGYWLYVQYYFAIDPARRPNAGAKSVTVTLPTTNVVNEPFVRHMRACKAAVLRQLQEANVRHE